MCVDLFKKWTSEAGSLLLIEPLNHFKGLRIRKLIPLFAFSSFHQRKARRWVEERNLKLSQKKFKWKLSLDWRCEVFVELRCFDAAASFSKSEFFAAPHFFPFLFSFDRCLFLSFLSPSRGPVNFFCLAFFAWPAGSCYMSYVYWFLVAWAA